MAEVLGVRPGTVKSRLSRAMVRLRASYLALAMIFIALLLATALVLTPTREAIAHWFGLGTTRIDQVTDARNDVTGLPPLASTIIEATPAQMEDRLGVPLPAIDTTALGAPDMSGIAPGSGVLFAWDDSGTSLRLTSLDADFDLRRKYGSVDTDVEVIEDLGDGAVAVDGPHVLATEGRRYAADRVVLWEDDDIEYRLESDLELDALLVIAHAIDDAN
jgi:hypothetical protein